MSTILEQRGKLIPVRFGLSLTRRIPTFKVLDFSYAPLAFFKSFKAAWGWKVESVNVDTIEITTPDANLLLTRHKAAQMISEYPMWKKHYVPRFSLDGKTVMSVGAGCGEDLPLWFSKKAERVICVEPDANQLYFLERNIRANGWNAQIIPRGFEASDLNEEIGWLKMDCEGCEENLLLLKEIPPSVIEVHNERRAELLKAKFGLKTTHKLSNKTELISIQ